MSKRNRSIHAYLTDEEYARLLRIFEGMRVLNSGARVNKGDVAAALLMAAVDDPDFIYKVRRKMTQEG